MPLTERERKLMMADHTKPNLLVYSHVYSPITDPNMKKMIQSTPGVQFDGCKALQCLRDHCFREPNDLTVQQLDSTWIAFTPNDVGINADSLSNAILFLNALNAKRPLGHRKSEDNIVIKLLSLFTPELCPTISTMCMVELSAAEADRRYWVNNTNGGHRCWKLLRAHLEPI